MCVLRCPAIRYHFWLHGASRRCRNTGELAHRPLKIPQPVLKLSREVSRKGAKAQRRASSIQLFAPSRLLRETSLAVHVGRY